MASDNERLIAVVRVRGRVDVRGEIAETLERLRLKRVNNCVIIKPTGSYRGMINICNNYIAYGEINEELLKSLLERNGIEESPEKIMSEGLTREIRGKLPFRLHPPRHGYKSTKRSVNQGGSLGYMGDGINQLIKRMI
ncbi:MAG: uL30 family ribosomal protein [Candidatus Marsarchaeota archaeon]|jgi:large subunit ribosomal protein L30|nr:uL30 family ribosomal protein [Candidatus Marsarchaeota archaeon]